VARQTIDVLISLPSSEYSASHEVTVILSPKRVGAANRLSTDEDPLPRPPFPMTSNTSTEPTSDVFGPNISPAQTVQTPSAPKGTPENPHNESYGHDDAGLQGSIGGLDRKFYIVIRGREVGKLFHNW
jgi:hypothetical protein